MPEEAFAICGKKRKRKGYLGRTRLWTRAAFGSQRFSRDFCPSPTFRKDFKTGCYAAAKRANTFEELLSFSKTKRTPWRACGGSSFGAYLNLPHPSTRHAPLISAFLRSTKPGAKPFPKSNGPRVFP
jgi:hypothetical protein